MRLVIKMDDHIPSQYSQLKYSFFLNHYHHAEADGQTSTRRGYFYKRFSPLLAKFNVNACVYPSKKDKVLCRLICVVKVCSVRLWLCAFAKLCDRSPCQVPLPCLTQIRISFLKERAMAESGIATALDEIM